MNSGATNGTCGASTGRRPSRTGGIERAGEMSVGSGTATWRVGSGDGMGSRLFGLMCVARAGAVARTRLTTAAFLALPLLWLGRFTERRAALRGFPARLDWVFFVFFKVRRLFPFQDYSKALRHKASKIL